VAVNPKERTWRGRPVRRWISLGSGALLIVQPLFLLCWFEFRQPGFFAEILIGQPIALFVLGVLSVAGVSGAVMLFRDSLKDFRAGGLEPGLVASDTVRPFFRVLCGGLGVFLTGVAFLLAAEFMRAIAQSEVMPVWLWLFLTAVTCICILFGGTCLHAGLLGRSPSWLCPRQRPEGHQAGTSDGA